ncbi:hypothetical protein P170DRAFT_155208 [Aspergillus steynii IBT 23096]|uniref:Uncharacterized protein n=1 Tax=Aspergillus steynii IBT 23096 TaxID=1392250 RepID=A0A2I2GDB1_9EURO|nr:uncharacterized protein P170DRAFT_155208 [Aspergillus steynii IBT 23096]PLB50850.1 hypothetical protein P170DRAFT_155208 [Aspergillus steynii IBT 23096]
MIRVFFDIMGGLGVLDDRFFGNILFLSILLDFSSIFVFCKVYILLKAVSKSTSPNTAVIEHTAFHTGRVLSREVIAMCQHSLNASFPRH